MQLVAIKKRTERDSIFEIVSQSVGPVLTATQAEHVRFFDNRRHAHGRQRRERSLHRSDPNSTWSTSTPCMDSPASSRPNSPRSPRRLRATDNPAVPPSPQFGTPSPEDDYLGRSASPRRRLPSVGHAFQAFCGSSPGMDGKNFAKLCKDTGILLDKAFAAVDADIVFAKVVPNGTRRMNLQQFEAALHLVAERRGLSAAEVMHIVAASSGPILTATRADSVRFYDDINAYTFSSCRT